MVAGVMAVMTLSAATWSSAPTSASGWDAVMSPSSSTTTIAPTTWKDSSASSDVAWSLDYIWQADGKVYYSRGKNGLQFGSGSAGVKGMTISSEDFSGTISKITLKGAKSNGSAKISVKVGESEFTINDSQSKTLSTTAADCEFTGNGSGKIEIMLSDNADGKYIAFAGLEVVYEETVLTPTLGNITVTYGANATPVVQDEILEGIIEGTLFRFSAENAESIVVTNSENTTIAQGIATAEWIATVTEGEELTVTAKLGDAQKTFSFMVEVVEAPKPVLGNLVVTYGDGIQVNEDDEISVEVGTTFTFSAENATNIKVESFMESLVVVNENANSATWIPESAFEQDGFTVTATDGTDSKTLTFLLTVTEPVKPANEFVKVTSLDQLNEANTYVIIGTSGGVFYGAGKNSLNAADASGNNRQAYVVSVANDKATVDLDKVDVFSLVKNGDNWYIKTGTGMYLNNSDEANKNKLLTEETPQDVAISLTTQKNATIQFLNGKETSRAYLRFNSANSSGPIFGCYVASGQNSVALYYKEGEVVSQPEVPTFDQMEDVATKVSMTSTKGELHVWTMEYDKDGKLVKENGEEMPVSIMAKAPADDKTWTNKVADEGVTYEIDVPTTDGNYLTIRAKSVLNGLHSEELVKNVDASGNVISGVEGVVADDENAPVEYFNLQGVRVAADQPGIYIRRQGSNVEKVSIAR